MFTVIKKPLTSNTLWDAENNCFLCKFEKGKLETNDTELAEKLKAMGYEVTGEPDKEKLPDGEEDGGQVDSQTEDESQEKADEPREIISDTKKTTAKRRNRKT